MTKFPRLVRRISENFFLFYNRYRSSSSDRIVQIYFSSVIIPIRMPNCETVYFSFDNDFWFLVNQFFCISFQSFLLFRNIVIMPEEPIPSYTIKDVWAHNVEEEFRAIRKLILKYPYVAMVSHLTCFFKYWVSKWRARILFFGLIGVMQVLFVFV